MDHAILKPCRSDIVTYPSEDMELGSSGIRSDTVYRARIIPIALIFIKIIV